MSAICSSCGNEKILQAAGLCRACYGREWRKRHPGRHYVLKKRYLDKNMSDPRNVRRRRQEWTSWEMELIAEEPRRKTERELSKLLGRSVVAIQRKRQKMRVAAMSRV